MHYVCMYVIQTYFVSAPSRVSSGALYWTVPKLFQIIALLPNWTNMSWSVFLSCYCSWIWRHAQPQANHSMPPVQQLRIPASASMINDSDWPPDRIGRQIAGVDAPVPPKPEHRVPGDTTVPFDVCSLQPVAGSWIWFFALLEASVGGLWSMLRLVQTLEYEAQDELAHSRFSELVRSVLRWCQIGQSCNSRLLWRQMNESEFVLNYHWVIDVLSVSVAADKNTYELSSQHEHPSSAPHRWQHPGRWRLFRRQSMEIVAAVLVYRSLQAVFYFQSRYTVSCWGSVLSGSMTSNLWFQWWCFRAQWEHASLL